MSRVFLDVGGNIGQTVEEVWRPKWRFDRIWSFEPMPDAYKALARDYGDLPGVTVCNFGLLDRTGVVDVYGTNNAIEASVWPTKTDVDETVVTPCDMVRATDFFRTYIGDADWVVMKLNCEGAETLILDDLIDSGEVWKVTHVMIDPDIAKVPGETHRIDDLLARFADIGFGRYRMVGDVMVGYTHQERISHWLHGIGTDVG